MYQLRGLYMLTDKEKAKRKQAHKDRLLKIKNRANNPNTEVVKAFVVNPRKKLLKEEYERVTEEQNRLMLKRISRIMTAPSKLSDEDYIKMKKLCKSLKGLRFPFISYINNLLLR